MAAQLRAAQTSHKPLVITLESYGAAYRAVGEINARLRQIELTQEIGLTLDKLSRLPLLRRLLRIMSRPARIGGVGGLHAFLERGYAAFADMGGANDFINAIVTQEREEHARLTQLAVPRNKSAGSYAK